jgi:hypothetical protein
MGIRVFFFFFFKFLFTGFPFEPTPTPYLWMKVSGKLNLATLQLLSVKQTLKIYELKGNEHKDTNLAKVT